MTTKFLEGESSTEIDQYRRIFERAAKEAKRIATQTTVDYYEITLVRFYTPAEEKSEENGCMWKPCEASKTATVAMSRKADPEAVTHEVGHSFFHGSPLHDGDKDGDESYGERFCNAFRYFLHPGRGTGFMNNDGGQYDAHELVRKCKDLAKGKSGQFMRAFREYFVELCEKKRETKCKRMLDAEGI